jgi:hypothetical protein
VSEETTPESLEEAAPRGGVRTAVTALDITGGALGLIVFLVGVALVIGTYWKASAWYAEIGPAISQARAGQPGIAEQPGEPNGSGEDKATGPVGAKPGGRPLADIGVEFGLRLLWLVLLAFLGFLVAVMGAKLAGVHRGKRT